MLKDGILNSVMDLGLINVKEWLKKQERMKLESIEIWVTAEVLVGFYYQGTVYLSTSPHTMCS